jgi:outer membrane protein TolC
MGTLLVPGALGAAPSTFAVPTAAEEPGRPPPFVAAGTPAERPGLPPPVVAPPGPAVASATSSSPWSAAVPDRPTPMQPGPAGAPEPVSRPAPLPSDTLELSALQRAAIERDPRLRQRTLERRATDLRLDNLRAARLPRVQLTAGYDHQSDVIQIPIRQPGFEIGEPPRDRYQASLETSLLLWDGGRTSARGRVEEARRDAALAELDARLHDLRIEVSEAFFGALLLQERLEEARLLLRDLDARLAEARARVDAGAGLPGDTAVVRAELLRARQQVDALEAERGAALTVLGRLTGRALGPSDVLSLPELAEGVAAVPGPFAPAAAARAPEHSARPKPVAEARLHPRYDVFATQRSRLRRQSEAVRAERRPRLSAFGQLSWGSPGFRQFDRSPHEYWRAGVQLEWRPWDWGTRAREREALEAQRDVVATEEDAFTERLLRAVQRPLRAMARARAALATDDEIIGLREQVERQARAQLAERAIPPSRYTDARTDLMEARVARIRHRVELAQAQAEYLLVLGVELP